VRHVGGCARSRGGQSGSARSVGVGGVASIGSSGEACADDSVSFGSCFLPFNLLRGSGRLLGARMVGVVARGWSDECPWGWPVGHILPPFLSFMALILSHSGGCRFCGGLGSYGASPWALDARHYRCCQSRY